MRLKQFGCDKLCERESAKKLSHNLKLTENTDCSQSFSNNGNHRLKFGGKKGKKQHQNMEEK